jgi:hypothetical protein
VLQLVSQFGASGCAEVEERIFGRNSENRPKQSIHMRREALQPRKNGVDNFAGKTISELLIKIKNVLTVFINTLNSSVHDVEVDHFFGRFYEQLG